MWFAGWACAACTLALPALGSATSRESGAGHGVAGVTGGGGATAWLCDLLISMHCVVRAGTLCCSSLGTPRSSSGSRGRTVRCPLLLLEPPPRLPPLQAVAGTVPDCASACVTTGTTSMLGVIGAGGLAGAIAGGACTPQDVIKTRLQTASSASPVLQRAVATLATRMCSDVLTRCACVCACVCAHSGAPLQRRVGLRDEDHQGGGLRGTLQGCLEPYGGAGEADATPVR